MDVYELAAEPCSSCKRATGIGIGIATGMDAAGPGPTTNPGGVLFADIASGLPYGQGFAGGAAAAEVERAMCVPGDPFREDFCNGEG